MATTKCIWPSTAAALEKECTCIISRTVSFVRTPPQRVSTHRRKVKHFYFGQNLNVIFVNVFQDRDAAGATALHLAARFGCVDVIKWLLSVGGGAQVETNCRAVPAHYSAASGDLTCLKLLIQQAPG